MTYEQQYPKHPGSKVSENLYPSNPWSKEVSKPRHTDWIATIKAKNWDKIMQVWEDFLGCDYDERCDALFSIIEEIVANGSRSVVPSIAKCPERDYQ